MIEFNGYLTGDALKHYIKKGRSVGFKIILITLALICPAMFSFAIRRRDFMMLGLFCVGFILVALTPLIPKSKKELKSMTPKRIYTDGESITCVTEKYVETKFVDDVKEVIDYGTFYDLVFPFGKISDKFVCQKDLLSQGTLKKFESLFKNKIIDKTKK